MKKLFMPFLAVLLSFAFIPIGSTAENVKYGSFWVEGIAAQSYEAHSVPDMINASGAQEVVFADSSIMVAVSGSDFLGHEDSISQDGFKFDESAKGVAFSPGIKA